VSDIARPYPPGNPIHAGNPAGGGVPKAAGQELATVKNANLAVITDLAR
jgi:hypothetical protein